MSGGTKPPGSLTSRSLFGWTPFRAAWHGSSMLLDWCHLGGRRMTEPFFYASIAEAMRDPFNLVFQQRTSVEALADLPTGVSIGGFIFHMSRCGSTLVSQALAAFESNIVLSEAAPLRAVLRAEHERATPAQARRWFRGLVNAYAQPRFSYEKRLYIKFMAADVLDIALVQQAFPDVPWIFVTRDPAEILASQATSAGIDLIRGQIPAPRLGLTGEAIWAMDARSYQAHALAAFGRAAIDAYGTGKGLILDHCEMPEALWTKVPKHFGLGLSPGAADVMWHVSRRHSKARDIAFVPDDDPNRARAAPFRPIAMSIVGPVMAQLAGLRA